MIVTVEYETDGKIAGCEGQELLTGDRVQLILDPIVDAWPEKVLGSVSKVCYRSPYGRKYEFEFDDSQLNDGPALRDCLFEPKAYCCCDELKDSLEGFFGESIICDILPSS